MGRGGVHSDGHTCIAGKTVIGYKRYFKGLYIIFVKATHH